MDRTKGFDFLSKVIYQTFKYFTERSSQHLQKNGEILIEIVNCWNTSLLDNIAATTTRLWKSPETSV
jgi:hypothetical protein